LLFTTDIQQIADYINEKSAPNPHVGISVRVTSDKFAHDPISGEGSRLVGGRFNIRLGLKDCLDLPDGIQAIYLADSPETALREANLIRQPSRIDRLLDDEGYTYFLIRYELSRVLDLTLGNIFDRQLLTGAWDTYDAIDLTAPTQRIALAAFQLGISALKVPSAQNQAGHNLVIFPANLDDKCSIDAHQVSKDVIQHLPLEGRDLVVFQTN
jgi:RES domain-containing protein